MRCKNQPHTYSFMRLVAYRFFSELDSELAASMFCQPKGTFSQPDLLPV